MSADDVFFWGNWVLVGALIVGVLATYAIVVSGNIRDVELKRGLKDKDDQIANATARGEEAKAVAAESNVRAEEAKERTLNAAKEVAKLQTAAAEAKGRQAVAEKRLAEVEIQRMPRSARIPSDRVFSILKTAPPGKAIIRYSKAHPESETFASGLNMRLQDAGWQIVGFSGVPSTSEIGASNSDIHLVYKDPAGFESDSSQALMRVFNAGSITVMGMGDPRLPVDTTLIIVNPHP